MHTIPELGTAVPAFLAKLWKLVEDPETDDLICWSSNGRSFIIKNQAQFARELLPHYYKHNNMASFVRQLNMYGFHKKVSVELGGLKCDKDEMEFAHQCFCKGHPFLVEHIKRKIANNKGQDQAQLSIKPELMNKMLLEVRSMRGRQENFDSKLGAMKHENEALWRELAMLRQKHLKQQEIVNKLIHFLVTLVQPSRGGSLSMKRRFPLMIDGSSGKHNRGAKMNKSQASPTGPVIHELDASEPELDSEYIVAEILENERSAIHSPEHTEISVDNNSLDTIHLVGEPMQLQDEVEVISPQEVERNKKHIIKGKKKRKNKVPVKILIPSLENGEKPREELHLLEMPVDKEGVTIALLNNDSANVKAVPVATVRSSKLAAMAANINKFQNIENDIDTLADAEDISDNDPSTLIKLEDILIVPEMINNSDIPNIANDSSGPSESRDEFSHINRSENVLAGNSCEQSNTNQTSKFSQKDKDNCDKASTSSTKDLSLSCVSSSGISEASYRLGSMEEMDNHLETMQTELENLRDILRGEGYSIDANTLLGLFSADDSMTFGLPVNPELNPNCDKENEDHTTLSDSMNGSAGGELMAYNHTSNLFDFDDIFLGNASSSLVTPTSVDLTANCLYPSDLSDPSDPLDLGDHKTLLLNTLVRNDENEKS